MPKETKAKKVTGAQIDCLCTFFEENPEIITGYKKTPKCIKDVQMKWKKITPHLNSLGPHKDEKGWAKYLYHAKAKLKKKRVKWRQYRDGSGRIICNADDFSEIGLRIFQVLRLERIIKTQSENGNASVSEQSEDNIKSDKEDSCGMVSPQDSEINKSSCRSHVELNGKPLTPQVFVDPNEFGDDFDMFGRNVAQQLRALPLSVALETQETLLSVLHKQRLKCMRDMEDPFE